MFLVCEPIAWGIEHVPFNAGLLKTIRTAFPGEKVCFVGERTHCEHVQAQLGPDVAASIAWETTVIPARQSGFYRRLPADARTVRGLIARMKQDPSYQILTFSSGNPSLLWLLKYHLSTFHKSSKVQIVLHGDFSSLRYRSSLKHHLNPFFRLGSFRTAVRFGCHKRAQYLVLEEAVLDVVLDKYPFLTDRFTVLEHPLPGDDVPARPLELVPPVKFGYLGRAYATKGFFRYLDVAAEVSRRLPGRAQFHLVGSITEAQQRQTIPNIGCLFDPPSTTPLSRDEYLEGLDAIHFACLFYDEAYEFTASGVLLDCVERGKPIVASRRTIFVKMQDRFSDLGYLCDVNEYADVVESIVSELDSDRYQRQVETMGAIKAARSTDVLGRRYHDLVGELLMKA